MLYGISILIVGKQFSLDSRMDLYGIDANTLSQDDISNSMIDENKSIKEDVEDSLEGTKSRYCSGT